MVHIFEDKTKMTPAKPVEFVTAATDEPGVPTSPSSSGYDHSIKHAPIPKIGKDCC